MRCYICDVELSESEIQLDEEGKSEPCTTCMNIIMDTAYTNGFKPGGRDEAEVDPLLEEDMQDTDFIDEKYLA